MIKDIPYLFFRRLNPIKLCTRIFNPKLFISDNNQLELEKEGFVHLKGIVDIKYTNQLNQIYHEANKMFNFYQNDKAFLNTMALKNSEAKKYLKTNTQPVLQEILSNFLILDAIQFPFGAAYCINPPNAEHPCNPHQDPAYVDEDKCYSLIVWIPLTDIDLTNGCLHVLPKSHLWGNSKRSISMDWAFEKYANIIWKYLIPIETKLGDVIVFDAALVHSSNINTTDSNRLAVNIPVLPRSEKMISYYKTGENKGYKFEIDESYYMDEYLFNKPSSKFKTVKNIRLNNNYKKEDVNKLIELSINSHENI